MRSRDALAGPHRLRVAGAGVSQPSFSDTNSDGYLDLVLQFRLQDTDLLEMYRNQFVEIDQVQDGKLDAGISDHQKLTASLTGETTAGLGFQGFAEVEVFLAGKAWRDLLKELTGSL